MANTMKALQTITVGTGGAASITFSNIPQTYTDLKIVYSTRDSRSNDTDSMGVSLNGVTAGTVRAVRGNGSTASSYTTTTLVAGRSTAATAAANVFGNAEMYIPNYANNVLSKSFTVDMVTENNTSVGFADAVANYFSSTSPITSVSIFGDNGNLVEYSTFTLYGIFNQDVSAVPATPTIGTATAGNESASITFTGVSGAASYTMTSSPGSITGTGSTSPVTVSGLTAGTAYTFTCKSNNPLGSSATSSASNSVTPYSLAYEFIGAASPTGTTVSFTSIPQTYKHLRLHIVGRSTYTAYDQQGYVTFNSDTGSNYRKRYTLSNGSTPLYASSGAAAYSWALPDFPGSYIDSNNFGSGVCEIFDYSDTNKITTLSGFGGYSYGGYGQATGYWNNTAAVTRIDIQIANGNWASGSHFALYGIKG